MIVCCEVMVDRLRCVGCLCMFRVVVVLFSMKVVLFCVFRSVYVNILCEGFFKVESYIGIIMEVL